jgi:hypothetical protein
MNTILTRNLVIATAALLFAHLSAATAATIPYTADFSGTPTDWANTTTATSAWTTATTTPGGASAWQATSTGGQAVSTIQLTNINATNIPSPDSFTIQATFTLTENSAGNNAYVGIGSFGTAASLGSGAYLADIQGSGSMRILSFNTGANDDFSATVTSSFGTALATNTPYTMTLVGTWVGTTLNLTFTVTDGGEHTGIVTATDLSPLTGQYFGLRITNSATAGTSTLTAQFTDFSAAITTTIPEPAAIGILAGISMLMTTMILRKRRASPIPCS